MASNLYDPPQTFNLPLSRGGGVAVDFTCEPSGTLTPYATLFGSDVTVTLVIDASPPISEPAVINGAHAVVKIEPAVTDGLEGFLLWRLIIASTIADPPVVSVNGITVRADGN
jgi:hypothetical protein